MNKSKITVHLIFVTKYRRQILDKSKSKLIISIIQKQAELMNIEILAINIDNKDHMHMMLRLRPNQSVSKVVQILKEKSRYAIWETHATEMRQYYWKKNLLWSRGYFCCSTGDASSETIQKYIENQG